MNKNISKLLIIIAITLFSFNANGNQNLAENKKCYVADQDINEIYTGSCLLGLANGIGTAKGKDTYVGSFKDGKKHGEGLYRWASGEIYEGEFKAGEMHGIGKTTRKNGDTYEGMFIESVPHGEGKLLRVSGQMYEGGFKHGKFNGIGIYINKDGKYEGDFKDGKFNGIGKTTLKDGDTYEGGYKNGKSHGKGILILKSGKVYEGDFVNGQKQGKGTQSWKRNKNCEEKLCKKYFVGTFKNGSMHFGKLTYHENDAIYEGMFQSDRKHGKGVYTWDEKNRNCKVKPCEKSFIGIYKRDKMSSGKLTYGNEDTYEGVFRNDKKHGKGIYEWGENNRHCGKKLCMKSFVGKYRYGRMSSGKLTYFDSSSFYEGVLDSKGISYGEFTWAKGDTYKGRFKEGLPDGKGKYTWSNGDIYRGQLKLGLFHGKAEYQWAEHNRNCGAQLCRKMFLGTFKEGSISFGKLTYYDTGRFYHGYFDTEQHTQPMQEILSM